VLAGPGIAQWRRFGEGQPAAAPSSLVRDMLAVHNVVRARVGTAPLAWSDRLAARSQDWADTLLAQAIRPPPELDLRPELVRDHRRDRYIRASSQRVGRGIPKLRLQLEQMPRRVRALHATRLG